MPRAHRRRTGTEAEQASAGRRHLAAIDPGVMSRVVGRPEQRDPRTPDAPAPMSVAAVTAAVTATVTTAVQAGHPVQSVTSVPPHRRPY